MSLERAWYGSSKWLILLRPLARLFGYLSRRRRKKLSACAKGPNKPILIVGNLSVGGSGKTPLIIELIRLAQDLGFKPGVISRGYGGRAPHDPLVVDQSTPVEQSGDEPKLITIKTGVPLVVSPDRVAAAELLSSTYDIDLIFSDDGLQHYGLKRDFEIAVIDGERGLGNGKLLPEGPLRELPSRLEEVDLVVVNGQSGDWLNAIRYQLIPQQLINLKTGELLAANPEALGGRYVSAIAGIGNPDRFFNLLRNLGFEVSARALRDHAKIEASDLTPVNNHPLIMTEKDAVKCVSFATENCWALSVQAKFQSADELRLQSILKQLCQTDSGEINGS